MKIYKLLARKAAWDMTVGEWLAALVVAPVAVIGFGLMVSGQVWGGALLVALAQILYYLIMGHDLDDTPKNR